MASVGKHRWVYKGVQRTKWIVRYTDQGGRRRGKTFDRKKDADKFRTKVETEVENAQHVPDRDTVTVRSLINQYLEIVYQRVQEGRLGRASAGNIEIALRKHLAPALGGMKIKNVIALDIEKWHGSLLNRLSPSTAKEVLRRVAVMESYAEKRGFTRCKAFRAYCDEVKGVRKERIRTFTTDEVVCLLRTLERRPPHGMFSTHLRMRCFVYLAICCGMRFGEIAGLTVNDIDFDAGFIRVRHSLTQLDELKGPKTRAGIRDVPVPMHLRELLRQWLATHYVENERSLVFLTRGGKGFRPSYFHDSWHDLLERAGLGRKSDQFHFHALRHFYASGMIEDGVSMPEVASLVGHESFDTTLQIYAHPIVGGNRRQGIVQRFASNLLARLIEAAPAGEPKIEQKNT